MKKRVSFVLTMFLVTFTLAMTGCAQKAKTAETPVQPAAQKSVTLTISAAASLTEAMGEIKTLYKKEKPNVTINYNFGSSGILQQQIEQGANADLFFSAATKQMTELAKKGLLIDSTKVNLLGNTVVLITKSDSTLGIKDFKDLKNSNIKKIALGESKTVPVGQYSEEILTSLKILDKVKAKAVYGKDVKEVLSWVESGDADAGVVYGTDAKTSKKVKVVAVAGKKLYKKPVVYPVAVIKASKNIDDTKAFLKYLSSDKAKAVFVKYGFSFLVK
ncbi:molybdate ABC transporter substrate-binding protein [Clostridium estertheticum]|nr:molybdate ABC transporter substrate-binding protein [Clostridium estertheticum]MBU3185139.1 molybdate ABC transporter substrate-binding protein [Clostridium estertheticum]MBW9172297.1 molybdate ABC transporter substrate-binding protein [Clostridium estertheticum]WBL48871.1 molybdate ABC transporter substrate-binding protein [Clostridium estertheticum]WLC76924.1 molybdate ABC transporter substrate-binding protein [Clostridium estertheticum]